VEKVLNPKAHTAFQSIRNNKPSIRHCIGIDTRDAWAVRSGVGKNNDLSWIGRAPEFAAQLSGIGKYPYSVYTSRACFRRLAVIFIYSGAYNVSQLVHHNGISEWASILPLSILLKHDRPAGSINFLSIKSYVSHAFHFKEPKNSYNKSDSQNNMDLYN
jgi:hypothetical protein